MPKFVWFESYMTICKFSAEITEEQASLFKTDPDKFYKEVSFQDNQHLEWDKVEDEKRYDHQLED